MSITDALLAAGWFEGRNVLRSLSLPNEFALFPTAVETLSEFAGLHFGICGPGIDCATSDVRIDPNLAAHLASELNDLAKSFRQDSIH